MNERIDITGQTFGKWTALEYAGNQRWKCRCACGAERTRDGRSLRLCRSVSCKRCSLAEKHPRTTHGHARTRLHRIWLGMRRRCLNTDDAAFRRYGARGIVIDPAWNDFTAFHAWAIANGYLDHLTLDRRNNDGPYSPINCRWATHAQQNRNYSRVIYVDYNGKREPLIDLAERFGLNPATLRQRVQRFGWDIERALNTPAPTKATITIGGQPMLLNEACSAAGLSKWMVRKRLARGWSIEEALKP
jgi:hypothetical protein